MTSIVKLLSTSFFLDFTIPSAIVSSMHELYERRLVRHLTKLQVITGDLKLIANDGVSAGEDSQYQKGCLRSASALLQEGTKLLLECLAAGPESRSEARESSE